MIGLSLQSTHWGYLGAPVIGICQWHNKCIISYSLVMKILVVFWPWKRAEKILVDVATKCQAKMKDAEVVSIGASQLLHGS